MQNNIISKEEMRSNRQDSLLHTVIQRNILVLSIRIRLDGKRQNNLIVEENNGIYCYRSTERLTLRTYIGASILNH